MGKVGDREVYESSEYDIADRIYVNILFFKKNLLFKQKYSFCTLFYLHFILPLEAMYNLYTPFHSYLPPANPITLF